MVMVGLFVCFVLFGVVFFVCLKEKPEFLNLKSN